MLPREGTKKKQIFTYFKPSNRTRERILRFKKIKFLKCVTQTHSMNIRICRFQVQHQLYIVKQNALLMRDIVTSKQENTFLIQLLFNKKSTLL